MEVIIKNKAEATSAGARFQVKVDTKKTDDATWKSICNSLGWLTDSATGYVYAIILAPQYGLPKIFNTIIDLEEITIIPVKWDVKASFKKGAKLIYTVERPAL